MGGTATAAVVLVLHSGSGRVVTGGYTATAASNNC